MLQNVYFYPIFAAASAITDRHNVAGLNGNGNGNGSSSVKAAACNFFMMIEE